MVENRFWFWPNAVGDLGEICKCCFCTPHGHCTCIMLNSTAMTARASFRTAKKLIIGRFRTMRSINLTGFANAVLTHGMSIVHVGSRTELLQQQETAFGQQKSWFLTMWEQYVDLCNLFSLEQIYNGAPLKIVLVAVTKKMSERRKIWNCVSALRYLILLMQTGAVGL